MALVLNCPRSGQRVATWLISDHTYIHNHPCLSASVIVRTLAPSLIRGLKVSISSDHPRSGPPHSRSKQMVLQSPKAKAHFKIEQEKDMHICKSATTIVTEKTNEKKRYFIFIVLTNLPSFFFFFFEFLLCSSEKACKINL